MKNYKNIVLAVVAAGVLAACSAETEVPANNEAAADTQGGPKEKEENVQEK